MSSQSTTPDILIEGWMFVLHSVVIHYNVKIMLQEAPKIHAVPAAGHSDVQSKISHDEDLI